MAKGGITKGKSHKEGGIPMEVKSTGQKVELEGGEGVINKRNMSDTKKHTFDGKQLTKCEIASEINSDNNNGVEIECDDITGKQYKYKKGGKTLIPSPAPKIFRKNLAKKYAPSLTGAAATFVEERTGIPAKGKGLDSDSGRELEKGGNLEYHKDSLGIARKDMPQIRKDNYPDFFNELKEDNVLYYNMYINPNDYKPTQSYIDLERIKEIEASPAYNNNKPILVSNDYYVLDGHHRWYYKRKIKEDIPAVIIDLPIRELIERARNFSAVEFDAYKKGGKISSKRVGDGHYLYKGKHIMRWVGSQYTLWNIWNDEHGMDEYALSLNSKKEAMEYIDKYVVDYAEGGEINLPNGVFIDTRKTTQSKDEILEMYSNQGYTAIGGGSLLSDKFKRYNRDKDVYIVVGEIKHTTNNTLKGKIYMGKNEVAVQNFIPKNIDTKVITKIPNTDSSNYAKGGVLTFKTTKEADKYLQSLSDEDFKKLGDFALVYNGKEYLIKKNFKSVGYAKGGSIDDDFDVVYIGNRQTAGGESRAMSGRELMSLANEIYQSNQPNGMRASIRWDFRNAIQYLKNNGYSIKNKSFAKGGSVDDSEGGEIEKSKYISMFADSDGDGIPNVDDVSPFDPNTTGQIEEVSMSEEMGEIINYRNKFENIRKKFINKLSSISETCGTAKCGILSRTKTPYSIINKMRRRSLTGVKDLEKLQNIADNKIENKNLIGLDLYKGLTDVVGAMVVAPNKETLEKLKGKLLNGDMGEVLEFEDMYAEPKAGYRAYHFIIGVKDKGKLYPIEVQLKTERAKNLSILSHTLYKRGKLDIEKYDNLFSLVEKADNGDEMSAMRIDAMLKNPSMIKNRIRLDDGANIKSLKEKFMEGGKITGTTIESLIPYYQLQALKEGEREILMGDREENLFLEDVEFGYKNIPKLRAQDGKGKNQVAYLHYFMGGSDFYITELNKESLVAFGYVIMNGDTQMSELGPIYIPELTDKTLGNAFNNMNIDQNFSPKTLNQVFQTKYTELAEDDFEVYEDVKVVVELETSDYLNMKFKNPYERNLVIRELIDEKADDPNNYTIDEKEFIRQYSGMGGLEKYGATGAGLLYEYYTPKEIVEKMWGLAYKHRGDIQIKDVLEPSCATGNFIGYAPLDVNITGYDIDNFSLSVCKILYPEERFTFYKAPFETLFFKGNKSVGDKVEPYYDLVIGNPPYGKFSGKYAGMGEKQATQASDYIDYFITRGLDLLKPKGLLIFIIGKLTQLGGKPFVEQMKSPNKGQIRIQQKADLVDAYRLPIGMFETTDVESEIIVLRKK
tara:strand:+ start:4699 stop:8583 length:3885 start_codon:yes stop_codon:yes gene_type:complete